MLFSIVSLEIGKARQISAEDTQATALLLKVALRYMLESFTCFYLFFENYIKTYGIIFFFFFQVFPAPPHFPLHPTLYPFFLKNTNNNKNPHCHVLRKLVAINSRLITETQLTETVILPSERLFSY